VILSIIILHGALILPHIHEGELKCVPFFAAPISLRLRVSPLVLPGC
jgi:hypothetical protein